MREMLEFDARVLDRARLSRDARFDGRFFIGVTSTRIYCRPICPSRTSKSCNVRYYPTAAAAAEAGFRPCLRCRPECAPGTPAWLGTSAVVRRALRLIEDGILDDVTVDEFATRMGIGARHLHRLFMQHVGASPLVVAQTRRLQFAKRLLDETNLAITDIALAAGFGSVRRFNDAFLQTYQRAPREMRKRRPGSVLPEEGVLVLRLACRPPYDWMQVRDFLAARAVAGVERVDERGYFRTVEMGDAAVIVCVRPADGDNALELRVTGAPPAALFKLSALARRAFDLAADPERISQAFASDKLIAPLVKRRPGLRIPGAWDAFECAVRAVLGQQVSVAAGRTLAARLVHKLGKPVQGGADGLTHLFPTPLAIAEADLTGAGITTARQAALRALAGAVVDGRLQFGAPVEEVTVAMSSLPGIGAWTAEYVALRALGEPDAFPATDLVLRRMTAKDGVPLSAREMERRTEAWRPWRSYAALHLWAAAGDEKRETMLRSASKRESLKAKA